MVLSHRILATLVLCVGGGLACADALPPTPSLEVSAARVRAGGSVGVSWQAPGANSVDLTDTEGRALRLDAPATGEVQVAILQSTELRVVARYASGDTEARQAVEATPRLVADLGTRSFEPGETRFSLRWDSLGASQWQLSVGGVLASDFSAAKLGSYEGVARGPPGSVDLELLATSGTLTASSALTVMVFAGEREPNDSAAEAEAIDGGLLGSIALGEIDLFSVEVAEGGHVQAVLHDRRGNCEAPGALRLLSEAGEVLAQAVGPGGCPELGPQDSLGNRDLPAGTYFVQVRGLQAADYLLQVSAVAPSCGNQVVESRAGEHCEPAAHPVLCRADCTADVIPEMEPNDRNRDAQSIQLGQLVAGRVDTPGARDFDIYAVELSEPTRLQISATGPYMSGCEFVLGGVALRSEDGRQLQTAATDQLGRWCGYITGHEQGELPPGRYYVVVDLVDLEGPTVPRYFLKVEPVVAPACGDGQIEGDELCDDGNLLDGDGCDAACALEPAARWTPRIEPYVLNKGPLEAGTATLIELEVDAPSRLIVDTFVPSEGRCAGPDEDVRLRLDGALLSDDGGLGRCAAADTFIEHEGAPQVHRLIVEPAQERLAASTVVVRLTPPGAGCGDLAPRYGDGEPCDDGNLVSGDGCSDRCALEPMSTAPIAAATTLSVPPLELRGQTVSFPLTVAQVDTLVTFTPRPGLDGFCAESFHMVLLDEALDFVGGQTLNNDGQCRSGAARAGGPGDHLFVVRNHARSPVRDLQIDFDFLAPSCGDGVFTESRNEACDDGGLALGDGCDDQCQVEPGLGVESEPNDVAAQANLLLTRTTSTAEQVLTVAAHQRTNDPADFFVIDNASGAAMWLDVYAEEDGACATRYTLRLTDASGTVVAEDVVGGLLTCQHLSPTEMPALGALPPGRYTLEVDRRSSTLGTYYLKLRVGSGVFR